MTLRDMGVLQSLKGLLVGRPIRYTEEEKQQLRDVVLERTRGYKYPIIADVDFGHTAPGKSLPCSPSEPAATPARAPPTEGGASVQQLHMGARAYYRTQSVKLARTMARQAGLGLAGSEGIETAHLAVPNPLRSGVLRKAIQYRPRRQT
jgi:hypothetical protein